jgi:hypothetical protein
MHTDPIHAGPVALAHAVVVATRARVQSKDSGRPERIVATPRPLQRLAQWWRGLDWLGGRPGDPVQLMLWSESWGRPYTASLGLVILMNHLRKSRIKGPPPP